MMKNNKIAIAKSDNGGFNIMTVSNNTPMSYSELDSFMHEIASAIAKVNRDENNKCEENLQMTESDEQLNAIKLKAVHHAQSEMIRLAKILMRTDEPFTEGMSNFFRVLAIKIFFYGWNSCCDNYGLEEGGEE